MTLPSSWNDPGGTPRSGSGSASAPGPVLLPVVFDSLTGNIRRFVQAVQQRCGTEIAAVPGAAPVQGFVLATYTFGSGQVPESTARFLARHGHLLRGVVVSGSFHWGENFGRAGDLIAAEYGVPLIARINKSGNAADREAVAGWLRAHAAQNEPRSRYGTLD